MDTALFTLTNKDADCNITGVCVCVYIHIHIFMQHGRELINEQFSTFYNLKLNHIHNIWHILMHQSNCVKSFINGINFHLLSEVNSQGEKSQ